MIRPDASDRLGLARAALVVALGLTAAALLLLVAGSLLGAGGPLGAPDPRPALVRALGLGELTLEPAGGRGRRPGPERIDPRHAPGLPR